MPEQNSSSSVGPSYVMFCNLCKESFKTYEEAQEHMKQARTKHQEIMGKPTTG